MFLLRHLARTASWLTITFVLLINCLNTSYKLTGEVKHRAKVLVNRMVVTF